MKAYGNKDQNKSTEIPKAAIDGGKYVIRHSRVVRLDTGDVMEAPSTVRIGIYSPDDYINLFEYNFAKTGVSVFTTVTGETAELLHDPTVKKSKPRGIQQDTDTDTDTTEQII